MARDAVTGLRTCCNMLLVTTDKLSRGPSRDDAASCSYGYIMPVDYGFDVLAAQHSPAIACNPELSDVVVSNLHRQQKEKEGTGKRLTELNCVRHCVQEDSRCTMLDHILPVHSI
jgi:hypothetical protein